MGSLNNPATPIPQFDNSAVPLEPTALYQGDSWNWERSFPDYPSELYQLTYIFNSPYNRFQLVSTGDAPPITPDTDGQNFIIQATSAQTAACNPDTYDVMAVLTGITGTTAAGEQVTLKLSTVVVTANLATATGPIDTRSFAKQNLDAIEAALLGNIDPSVMEYTINGGANGGRQVRRFARHELLMERAYWRDVYNAELAAAGVYVKPKGFGFRFTPTSS